MPIYEYRCRSCGNTQLSTTRGDTLGTCQCGAPLARKFSFSARPMMHSHFNHSVGQEVSDPNQYAALLRKKSDEASEHSGIEHRFVPVDPDHRPADLDA